MLLLSVTVPIEMTPFSAPLSIFKFLVVDDNDDLDAVEKKRQRETHRRQSRDDELLSSDHMNQVLRISIVVVILQHPG